MEIKQVTTEKAPAAIGPYSQAIIVNGVIYTSGQIPINPETGELVCGTIEDQTKQVLDNLKNLLAAAGSSLAHVVKTTVFIKDMNDFAQLNNVYAEYFDRPFPARSTVEVARLPRDVLVEIEVVAVQV